MKSVQLYLTARTTRSGGQRLRCGDHKDLIHGFDIKNATFERSEDFFPEASINVPETFQERDVLYLAVVRYSDSDSYSRSVGNAKITACFDSEDAMLAYRPANDVAHHPVWKGWGSSFECVEFYKLNMKLFGYAELIGEKSNEDWK